MGDGGVKYYLQDWLSSVRAGVNAGGFVRSRTDHQAFGEEIASGIGLRTTAQGFGAPQANRQGYGLTEKDSTGLNHTWFRKNENRAGRWTSPDPYNGSASVANPQSWNRYSYVESQPTNYVDPSGLELVPFTVRMCFGVEGLPPCYDVIIHLMYIPDPSPGIGGGGGGAGPPDPPDPCDSILEKIKKALSLVAKRVREIQQDVLDLVPRGIITNQDLESYISRMNDGRDRASVRQQGSVQSHRESFTQAQTPLKRAVRRFDINNCSDKGYVMPEGAKELAFADPPVRIRPIPNIELIPSADRIAEVSIAGVVIYWIVSAGSRIIFPARNLVPVP